ncbi:branched-chain amino acid ABC transporter permease (plasmid) [Phaeobacter sp. G2]|nr:branched-chain amino acid ABC transporter permease [Phaeobacter sp. G2]
MRVLFRKSYKQDIRLFRDRTQAFWYLLFLCIALAAPLFLDGYFLDELSFVYIYAIAGLGLMILTGFSGQVSFGQAAFVAIGAYAHTILLSRYGVPWILSLPLAALITGLVGLAIGRMHGLYLAIATLSIAIVTERLIGGGGDFTGGHRGLPVPGIDIFGIAIDQSWKTYLLNLALFVGAILMTRNLLRTRSGRALIAIRDSEVSARSLGTNVAFYKAYAFFLSAVFAGLAGGLLAHAFYYITPETFGMGESIRLLLMIVVGGIGTIHGAIFGAFFIVLLPTVLSWVKVLLPGAIATSGGFDSLAFGMILLGFILFEPDGLYGRWVKIHHYFNVFPMYKRRSFQRQKTFLKTERLK